MRRLLMISLSICCLLAGGQSHAAGPTILTNGQVTAEFGDAGLLSLTDVDLAQTHRFEEDDFAVTVSGQPFDSRKLPAPSRSTTKTSVTYAWKTGQYRFSVVYTLAPGWHFLSRQVSVVSTPRRTFRVDDVSVIRATVADRIREVFVPKSVRPTLGTGDYGACLRFDGSRGLLVVAQNPFLRFTQTGQGISLAYKPDMSWDLEWGPFVADRALIAPYRLVGRRLPERMLPEWRLPPAGTPPGTSDSAQGMDEAEVDAFTDMVRAFLLTKPAEPTNVLVGWCSNDYQIDVATPEGRQEYRRIIDRAADLGARYVLYAPSNSMLSFREQSVDDWSWEHVLWLNLGQQIRKHEWDPNTSAVPASVQEMVDYAASKNVKLLAYVYPVLPFSQNAGWLTRAKNGKAYANLGFRSLQDWLIDALVAFHDRLGLGGYAFDHTFLTYEGTSRYAQWFGWRRVMEELRRRIPDIVIDGRQAYHLYGPWSWLAGSYPHPTFNDEQPESFVPFPDLHFDRVSADRERYTAYRYRNYEFAPSEIVPGFITHQTSRSDDTGEMPQRKTDKGVALLPLRQRDWDYLGWRYSLLSSIAVAGWNNVLDMVPARDPEENRAFSDTDRAWFRKWIAWTNTNKDVLRRTRTILGEPAIGKVDGTAAIAGGRGFIFLFNPNAAPTAATVRLDDHIGVARGSRFLLKELHPLEGRTIGHAAGGIWAGGDELAVTLAGHSALVLELQPSTTMVTAPLLLNVPGRATLGTDVLRIEGVQGEAGSSQRAAVVVPASRAVKTVRVNGRTVPFERRGDMIWMSLQFEGAPFRTQLSADTTDGGQNASTFTGGVLRGRFSVPQRIFEQLAARRQAWPIKWTAEDYRTTWLAPERLLLFVEIAEPDDRWEARLKIDDRAVELRKGYSAVRAVARTFVGFYADLSLVSADTEHTFELELPTLNPGQLRGVFFENVEPQYTSMLRPPSPASSEFTHSSAGFGVPHPPHLPHLPHPPHLPYLGGSPNL